MEKEDTVNIIHRCVLKAIEDVCAQGFIKEPVRYIQALISWETGQPVKIYIPEGRTPVQYFVVTIGIRDYRIYYESFPDPLLCIYHGRIVNKTLRFLDISAEDIHGSMDAIVCMQHGFYIYNKNAPNFFERLSGRWSNVTWGYEGLIYMDNQSMCIDHVYLLGHVEDNITMDIDGNEIILDIPHARQYGFYR